MKKSLILIVTALLAFSQWTFSQTEKKQITLKDIWTYYKFYPKTVRGIVSLNNGTQYTSIKKGSIVVYDYKTGDSVATLVAASDLVPEGKKEPIKIGNFKVNRFIAIRGLPSITFGIRKPRSFLLCRKTVNNAWPISRPMEIRWLLFARTICLSKI